MMTMSIAIARQTDAETITHAFIEAGRALGMTLGQLARVIGVSESAMKNYSRGSASISSPKDQELSLGLIRVYRALFAILGGDRAQMRHWMRTPNRHLNGQEPVALAANYQGLAELNVYLDAMRGRL
jgi:transcriptional regulator with XRE-family HTH domain